MKHNLESLKKNFTREELAELEKELGEMLEKYRGCQNFLIDRARIEILEMVLGETEGV